MDLLGRSLKSDLHHLAHLHYIYAAVLFYYSHGQPQAGPAWLTRKRLGRTSEDH